MSKNQKGLAHIVVMVILALGLGSLLYLSQQTQIFKPKAYEKPSDLTLNAQLDANRAIFEWRDSSPTRGEEPLIVDMSTRPGFETDIYMSFAIASNPPEVDGAARNYLVEVTNPQVKWDKYTCGVTLYWRVTNKDRSVYSQIMPATVSCAIPPTTQCRVDSDCPNIGGKAVCINGKCEHIDPEEPVTSTSACWDSSPVQEERLAFCRKHHPDVVVSTCIQLGLTGTFDGCISIAPVNSTCWVEGGSNQPEANAWCSGEHRGSVTGCGQILRPLSALFVNQFQGDDGCYVFAELPPSPPTLSPVPSAIPTLLGTPRCNIFALQVYCPKTNTCETLNPFGITCPEPARIHLP